MMSPIKLNDKTIGHMWQEDEEGFPWHCEHSKTGMSWAAESRETAIKIVVDHEEEQ